MLSAWKPAEPALSARALEELYLDIGLEGALDATVFQKAIMSSQRYGARKDMLAIADMTRPSTEKRLFIIDLSARKLVLRTWVAHGRNSGDLYCTEVSNTSGSLQTSKGMYRVQERIISPKHGAALMLDGLERGVNDRAREREIIMHGAAYVSADFIAQHGRLGRSFGCPAVPVEEMSRMIELLADGGLLYVHAR